MRARIIFLGLSWSLLAASCQLPTPAQQTATASDTASVDATLTDMPVDATDTPAATGIPASETPSPTATSPAQLSQSPCAGHNPSTPPAPTATQTPAFDLTPGADLTVTPPTPEPTRTPNLPPPPYQTPVPLPTNYGPNPKYLRITLHMQGCELTVEAASLDFGLARSDTGDPDQFFVLLHGFSGQDLGEFRTWDPRAQAVYQGSQGSLLTDPFSIQQEVTADLILPFNDHLATIEMTDAWGYVYARYDLVGAIQAFCRANTQDPECAAWLSSASNPPTPTP